MSLQIEKTVVDIENQESKIHQEKIVTKESLRSEIYNFYQNFNTNRPAKLLFCFFGLQASYLLWGIAQEQLMTSKYKTGTFKNSTFCVFANRVLALLIALIIVYYKHGNYAFSGDSSRSKENLKQVPFYLYAPSSISNTLSSWAQYEALKYISFPSQVLSKSCKIIPVMLVGILINKKNYPLREYIDAILITVGVLSFTFSDKLSGNNNIEKEDTFYGIFLLIFYLFCDSFTSQWQSKVYKSTGIDQYQMMLGVNIWSMIFTGFTLIKSNEFFLAIGFLLENPLALYHITLLSITSATGQLFIFYTIKELGPVIFTIIMTTRQLFSLVISCFLFSHSISWTGWISCIGVFLVVFNRIYSKGSD